jgi:nucleoside-diphosphate-sugar epimerase
MDRSSFKGILEASRPSGLVHLAWDTTPGTYWRTPANLEWLAASLGLLREFVHFGGKRILVAGTSAEYEWGGEGPLDESTSPLRPNSLYGCSRNALREVLGAWASNVGVSWAWCRLFNLFGPEENEARLLPKVIRALIREETVPFDDGRIYRDFLHVADAGDAISEVYASPAQGCINVASGEPIEIRELLATAARHLGGTGEIQFGVQPTAPNQPRSVVASVSRLRTEIGWKPAKDLAERVRETCDWWRTGLNI